MVVSIPRQGVKVALRRTASCGLLNLTFMRTAFVLTALLFLLRYDLTVDKGGILMQLILCGIGISTVAVLAYLAWTLMKEDQ